MKSIRRQIIIINVNVVAANNCLNGGIFIEASNAPNMIDHNVVWGNRGEGIYEHVRVNYTPGIIWLTALVFRLFGAHILGPRLLMVAAYGLACR